MRMLMSVDDYDCINNEMLEILSSEKGEEKWVESGRGYEIQGVKSKDGRE